MFITNWIYPEESSRQPRNCCRCSRHGLLVCCAHRWHVDQGGGTSRDDGRALSVRWNYTTYNSYPGYPTYGSLQLSDL